MAPVFFRYPDPPADLQEIQIGCAIRLQIGRGRPGSEGEVTFGDHWIRATKQWNIHSKINNQHMPYSSIERLMETYSVGFSSKSGCLWPQNLVG